MRLKARGPNRYGSVFHPGVWQTYASIQGTVVDYSSQSTVEVWTSLPAIRSHTEGVRLSSFLTAKKPRSIPQTEMAEIMIEQKCLWGVSILHQLYKQAV